MEFLPFLPLHIPFASKHESIKTAKIRIAADLLTDFNVQWKCILHCAERTSSSEYSFEV